MLQVTRHQTLVPDCVDGVVAAVAPLLAGDGFRACGHAVAHHGGPRVPGPRAGPDLRSDTAAPAPDGIRPRACPGSAPHPRPQCSRHCWSGAESAPDRTQPTPPGREGAGQAVADRNGLPSGCADQTALTRTSWEADLTRRDLFGTERVSVGYAAAAGASRPASRPTLRRSALAASTSRIQVPGGRDATSVISRHDRRYRSDRSRRCTCRRPQDSGARSKHSAPLASGRCGRGTGAVFEAGLGLARAWRSGPRLRQATDNAAEKE